MLLSSFGEEKSGDVHGHHFSDLILGFLTQWCFVWWQAKAEIEERKKRELAELQDKVEQLIAAGELPGREKERRGIGSKLKDTLACNYGGWETKKFFTKHKTPKHRIVLKQFSVFPKARLTIPISTQLFRHEERGIIYITKRFIHNPNQLHQLYTTRI
jgi:hypothetical protein